VQAVPTCDRLMRSMSLIVGVKPTLSCPARSSESSCDPMYTQCMRAHAFLHHGEFRRMALAARGNVRLGETSSMLVALRMLLASSDSCLQT
jgi:hypothetical protein